MDEFTRKKRAVIARKERRLQQAGVPAWLEGSLRPVRRRAGASIPPGIRAPLEKAFFRGFELVFERGIPLLEKTYGDRSLRRGPLSGPGPPRPVPDAAAMRRLEHDAWRGRIVNEFLVTVEGGALGALGIGLPDIPLVLAMILRTLGETADAYGFDAFGGSGERSYALLLICAALAPRADRPAFYARMDRMEQNWEEPENPPSGEPGSEKDRMEEAARVLAGAILGAKFIQGVPVVGITGGLFNYRVLRKVSVLADLRYRKRCLWRQARGEAGSLPGPPS